MSSRLPPALTPGARRARGGSGLTPHQLWTLHALAEGARLSKRSGEGRFTLRLPGHAGPSDFWVTAPLFDRLWVAGLLDRAMVGLGHAEYPLSTKGRALVEATR